MQASCLPYNPAVVVGLNPAEFCRQLCSCSPGRRLRGKVGAAPAPASRGVGPTRVALAALRERPVPAAGPPAADVLRGRSAGSCFTEARLGLLRQKGA